VQISGGNRREKNIRFLGKGKIEENGLPIVITLDILAEGEKKGRKYEQLHALSGSGEPGGARLDGAGGKGIIRRVRGRGIAGNGSEKKNGREIGDTAWGG